MCQLSNGHLEEYTLQQSYHVPPPGPTNGWMIEVEIVLIEPLGYEGEVIPKQLLDLLVDVRDDTAAVNDEMDTLHMDESHHESDVEYD